MNKAEKELLLGSNDWKILSDILLETTVKGAEVKLLYDLMIKIDANFSATVERESLENNNIKQ
tara:strand:- start:998 stop:1186 length:189 start_codon:yes stop_codon:yes gene_type:complete